ncbi:hypothetical protein MCO_00181 [Bartonella sp. DB5-6]|uniref:type II toxin-antitoxin system RatA family toxin n=1 Tax=Bartonella sp. DB5-6 TaxID=1094755 RepID=UPI00026E8F6B|nr:type II toxin-antitoxin system RatA family toxin [Bartonella sp. DB5-6]EJF80667.1 hypothetical protein MCO_00181 [Bartonella sp. DB5-6]
MPTFTTHRQIAHSASEMFDLVSDIERYPEFLPMCEALVVRSRKEYEEKTLLLADMIVGYKVIREIFTTQVLLQPKKNLIEVKYIDGPFRYLENRWTFYDIENTNACNVAFFIDYEFKSKMLGLVMGSMFDIAFRKFTDAFEMRAHRIYGPPVT